MQHVQDHQAQAQHCRVSTSAPFLAWPLCTGLTALLVTSGQSTGLVFWLTWCHVQGQQARARDGPPAEASHSVDNLGKLPSIHSLVRLALAGASM